MRSTPSESKELTKRSWWFFCFFRPLVNIQKDKAIKKAKKPPSVSLCSIVRGAGTPYFVTAGNAGGQRRSWPRTIKLKLMAQLNKIEIRGNVGTIRLQVVGNTRVAKISVATNYVYKGRDGDPVIETTWHYVSAWEGKNIPDLSTIHKGDKIYVAGRLRSQRYTAADGTERTAYDVLASRLNVIESDESLQYEFL